MSLRSGSSLRALVAAPLACAVLVGCAGNGSTASGTGPQVAAAFYPLAYVAERVAGSHADVVNLTVPGMEPHDLELGFSQTVSLTEADLVVYEAGFQPSVDAAVQENAQGDTLDAATVVEPLSASATGDGDQEIDPHFWQDPMRMALLGDAVAARLAKLDPTHAQDYEDNALHLRADLSSLDQDYATALFDCSRRTVVVSHNAFGYLQKYGLVFEPIAGLSPGAEPTAADLARLRELIATDAITTVFSETLVSPKLAETLARDAGVRTAVLDPLEGPGDTGSGQDYLSLMRSNLAALTVANGCRA